MVAGDPNGQQRSYLVSEEGFAFVKRLEQNNLIVPIVGNFAGPRALRLVGEYLAEKSETVSVFYLSNVEEYLRRDGTLKTFCANAAALPIDDTSLSIRSVRGDAPDAGFRLTSELGALAAELRACDQN